MGGYYDAGDNVKYGLPMAFTITTLSWAAIFYQSELQAAGEIQNVRSAIRWGTDYFLKAGHKRDHLFVQVRRSHFFNLFEFIQYKIFREFKLMELDL